MELDADTGGLSSPLCLQNICRINLLFRLEEYPVQQLLLLPLSIRRDLSLSLSPVDVLHYETAGLFHDFDTASAVESAQQKLLDITLGRNDAHRSLFIPSILSALVPEGQLDGLLDPAAHLISDHISESFSSLQFEKVPKMDFGSTLSTALIPGRFHMLYYIFYNPSVESLKLLLEYCHFLKASKEVKIDVINFLCTRLWMDFRDSLRGKREVVKDPVIPILQSFLSHVETLEIGTTQLFEESRFEFGEEGMEVVPIILDFSAEKAATYIILYNMITNPASRLKHVKIFGVRREVIEFIVLIAEQFFTDGLHITMATRGYWRNDFPCSLWFPLQLATAPPLPYLLQSLSITHIDKSVPDDGDEPDDEGHIDRYNAKIICTIVRAIVLFQLKNLKHVSIDLGTDFCYDNSRDFKETPDSAERNYMIPENRELLSTLTDLLKQPQLQSLSVGRAPLTEAYQMIKVFLCTETTHTLSLTIEGVEEESKWVTVKTIRTHDSDSDLENFEVSDDDSDDFYYIWKRELGDDRESCLEEKDTSHPMSLCTPPLPPPLVQPLPDSNGALKILDIGCSCDHLHAWLFSIPNLQLKELKTSRPDSSGIPLAS